MLTFLALLIAALPTILTAVFVVEVAAGLRAGGAGPAVDPAAEVDGVVVMPAHDEAPVIGRTLAQLRAALGPRARVLVVADNCVDDTAASARAAGAEVIVRTDPGRRGKGFALAFARDHLRQSPPTAVAVIDADCGTNRASLDRLFALAAGTGRPVQAVNLLRPDLKAAPMVQVSNFAFMLKNLVRQRGLARLGGRVNLTGTGMAFPWPIFSAAPLATDDVVEDLGLGIDLSASGRPPLLASDATVWSGASTTEGTLKQRTRWEGGFLSTSLRRALPLAMRGLGRGDLRLAWSGLSLAVPPLALLAMLDGAALFIAAGLALAGASIVPAIVLALAGIAAAVSVVVVWRRFGRAYLSPASAARLPLYVLWKLPMYVGLAKRRPKAWLRSGR